MVFKTLLGGWDPRGPRTDPTGRAGAAGCPPRLSRGAAGQAGVGGGIGGSLQNHAWLPRAPGLEGECVGWRHGCPGLRLAGCPEKVAPFPTWQSVQKGFVFECSRSLSLLWEVWPCPHCGRQTSGHGNGQESGRGMGGFTVAWGQPRDTSVLHHTGSSRPEQSTLPVCCIPCWEQPGWGHRAAHGHQHSTPAGLTGAGPLA